MVTLKGKWKWSTAAKLARSKAMKGKRPVNIDYATRKTPTKKYDYEDVRVLRCFYWMQNRCVRSKRACGFARTKEGYKEFQDEIGPIPENMNRPSVGRIDHDYGYQKGNIKWEEYSYNRWRQRRPEQKTILDKEEEIPF